MAYPLDPDEQFDYNRRVFRGKADNSLVGRVYRGETTFEREVEDLFYYFSQSAEVLKGAVRPPTLREDHDSRLYMLKDAVNDLAVIYPSDVEAYRAFSDLAENPPIRTPLHPLDALEEVLRRSRLKKSARSQLTYYHHLASLDVSDLEADKLSVRLQRRVAKNAIGVSGLVLGGIAAMGFVRDYILGALLIAGAGYFIQSHSGTYAPLDHKALKEKAKRSDRFVKELRRRDGLIE